MVTPMAQRSTTFGSYVPERFWMVKRSEQRKEEGQTQRKLEGQTHEQCKEEGQTQRTVKTQRKSQVGWSDTANGASWAASS